ncbi:unnamed protein product, partial [Prorocentrum cordatum]
SPCFAQAHLARASVHHLQPSKAGRTMGGLLDPKTRLLCKQKIAELEQKLEEIEALKAVEPKLRRELHAQREKLAQCASDDEGEGAEELPEQSEEPAGPDPQKRLKALNKKLKQIAELKAKGGDLDPAAAAKVASEAKILREIDAIKAGKPFDEADEAEVEAEEAARAPERVDLPADAAEREKRLKALNKKLQQIADLRKKEAELDDEAKAKVASKWRVKQEIAALESGAAEAVFTGPTEEDQIEDATIQKVELEKKLKAVRKKLTQIDALKSKGGELDTDARAKVDSEGALKKDLGALERQLGALNRAERERVAKRLGWEETCPDAKQKPGSSKK